MTEVVSIKFRNRGKMYYFDPAGFSLKEGDQVIVETSKGLEIAKVLRGNHEVDDEQVVSPLRPVERVATEDDLRVAELCRQREREAYIIGKKKIEARGLEMKLVDVECSFEGNKIVFFFSSEGRVDFRELVKDLAGVFRTRIELRQIGVRDEARMLGGLGICGRPFCCCSFMDDFKPVSTKMAKVQSLSLNPAKISGCCGRLMCCLRYEQPAYEELVKNVPKNGAFVETPDGYGNVTQVNILAQTVRVKLDGGGDDMFRQYDAEDVAAVPGGRPRDGSTPPHVLVLKPKKPKEPEEETSAWEMPEMLISAPGERERRNELYGERRDRPRRNRKESADGAAAGENGSPKPNRQNNRSRNRNDRPKSGDKQTQEKQGQNKTQNNKNRQKNQQRSKPQEGSAPVPEQAQAQKPRNKNYHSRRRPYNKRPKNSPEGGGAPKKEG